MAKATYTADDIIKSMKNKDFKPVYLLMGEEEYFIDQIADYAKENILCEEECDFNLNILYGKDIDCNQIVMMAKQYPVMSEYQVIIVKEAQNIKDFSAMSQYLPHAQKSSIIILCHKHGTVDKRKKAILDIGKYGIIFESKRLYDNQVPMWISTYVRTKGITIEPKASNLLSEFVGANLSKLVQEIDKLILIIAGTNKKTITSELVEENVGISKDYNNFELINAVMERNELKANRIINYFAEDPSNNPLVVTTSMLFNFFANLLIYHWLPDKSANNVATELKINPYFVKDYVKAANNYNSGRAINAVSLLRELDAKSKGFRIGPSGYNEKELLREYIYKIMH